MARSREERLELLKAEFTRFFPSLQHAKANMFELTTKRALAAAKGNEPNWYYLALSLYAEAGQKRGNWYENALPGLLHSLGYFDDIEKAKAFSMEVKACGKQKGIERVSRAKRAMDDDELMSEFSKRFPSLEDARGKMESLACAAFVNSDDKPTRDFYNTAIIVFSKADGRNGNWYDEVLPGLVMRASWFDNMDEARKFAEEVRKSRKLEATKPLKDMRRNFSKEEIVEAFRQAFPSMEETEKDLSRLSAAKAAKEVAGGGAWLNSAKTAFMQQDGKNGKWYRQVLPGLAMEAGWFTTIEEAREFASEVREFSSKERNKKMGKEEIIQAFSQAFPSLEEARRDISALSRSAVRQLEDAKGRRWFHSAGSIFRKSKGKSIGSWYGMVLPNLALEAGWFGSFEEAREFSEEVRRASIKSRAEETAKKILKMGMDEIVEGFQNDFPSLKEAEKDLAALGRPAIVERLHKGHWYYSARTIFRREGEERADWYRDSLPQLILKAGWFSSEEEARAFVEKVEAAASVRRHEKHRRARGLMSKEQVVEAFMRCFPSLEAVRANPASIGPSQIHKKAKGGGKEAKRWKWFHPAVRIFGGESKKWYESVLPALAFRSGWFATMEEALEFGISLRDRDKMDEHDIYKAFSEEFPSKAAVVENPALLSPSRLAKKAKEKSGHWFFRTGAMFKEENGKPGKWYPTVLPHLMLGAGWFDTLEEARDFSNKVKEENYKQKMEGIWESKGNFTIEEAKKAFTDRFPSLEEARKEKWRLAQGALKKSGLSSWVNSSKRIFSGSNGASWYDDTLPKIMVAVGWFDDFESAREFAHEVRDEYAVRAGKKISRALSGRKLSEGWNKSGKKYAIVAERLSGAKKGTSFSGISDCLQLCETEVAGPNGEGMGQLHISPGNASSGLSTGELVRLSMSTDNWGGELAKKYSEGFAYIAPYLSTRLLMLHAIRLSIEGDIPALGIGASFLSGPGEVHGALEDLKAEIEYWDQKLPTVIDIDAEPDMLRESGNALRANAMLPDSPIKDGSLSFVECSSLYQFHSRKHPSLVKEILSEARRVLKEGSSLLLASTGKRFCGDFEEGLRKLGFDIVMDANSRIELDDAAQERIGSTMGQDVLDKAIGATRSAYYLIAVKSGRDPEDSDPEMFRFERLKAEVPKEAKGIAAISRKLDSRIEDSTDSAIKGAEVLEEMLDGLPAEAHISHARLIQSVISRFMLDPKIVKPDEKPERLEANAKRLVEELSVDVRDAGDKYFKVLRRAAQTHRNRLLGGGRERPRKTRKA
ncbi:MAG: hypothetical protein ABII71_04740 [Candidatus Micrarchaeota archaeon]